jgi:threonine dehydratase
LDVTFTGAMSNSPTLADIESARSRIAEFVHRTPLVQSRTLSERLGTNVYLKAEVFQRTGSFKVRGAFNKMLLLGEVARERGVVAMSGGNHAQAVAYAARELGVRALIFMPQATPQNYVQATKGYGAEVVSVPTPADGFREMEAHGERGWAVVHPFDDPAVMAGQGTAALEILDDLPEVTDVLVSIGGGGLMGGVATAVKSRRPKARVWGVETVGADCMAQALAAGRVVTLPKITSIARTLGAPAASVTTLALAQKYLESVTVVSDADAVAALRFLLERTKILTEPAASCTLAAAEQLRAHFGPQDHVVLVLCGGNLALDDLCRYSG